MAEQSARAFSVMYGPDGAYDEGVGYWGYTSTHMAILASVMMRRLGKDLSSIINYPGTVRYGLRMWMPTDGRPNDCVDFGDAWEIGDMAIGAWTARRFQDRIAQYVALHVGDLKSPWSVIWFDPGMKEEKPGAALEDVRFSNDWVVGRSGWGVNDGVAALRSGGPANHEHADRNSVIFKAYGERIYHDPFHAAYPYTDPLWVLRLTKAHSAVLIDGKGHQYHDGHEGTNASLAEARVVRYSGGGKSMTVTSDATDAYRLVNPDVGLVERTAVFLKPDVLAILDRVSLKTTPLTVQARFQVDNSDGKGSVAAGGDSFTVARPGMRATTLARGTGAVVVRAGALDIPSDRGVYPYAEVESASALEHVLLTVCAAAPESGTVPRVECARDGAVWRVTVTRAAKTTRATINASGDVPAVTIEEVP
jgi:hypothetical protein